jgi:hypothetical protein
MDGGPGSRRNAVTRISGGAGPADAEDLTQEFLARLLEARFEWPCAAYDFVSFC